MVGQQLQATHARDIAGWPTATDADVPGPRPRPLDRSRLTVLLSGVLAAAFALMLTASIVVDRAEGSCDGRADSYACCVEAAPDAASAIVCRRR